MRFTDREVELLEGMIETNAYHAMRAARMETPMGDRQYGWDMERVELLKRILRIDEEEQAGKTS